MHTAVTLVDMRNRYKPSTPRVALALASVATAVVTMGAMVVLPAKLEFADGDQNTLASASATASIDSGAIRTECANESEPDADTRILDTHVRATRILAREQR